MRSIAVGLMAGATLLVAGAAPNANAATWKRVAPRQQLERTLILGGEPAAPGTLGMLAFVSYIDPGDDSGFICSGTVIAPKIVLTAGHCGEDITTGIPYQPSGYAIVTGSLDWTDPAARQVSAVSQVVVNPRFDPSTVDGDAALLILTTPTTAPAVSLANDPGDLSLLDPGTPAEIAGWGLTTSGVIPDQLQWGVTAVQSPAYCAEQAPSMGLPFDLTQQMCTIDAPTFGDGTCKGDSGGPVLAQRADGTVVEIGVTSWGAPDCDTGEPDFFTRADAIAGWANDWIQAVDPAPAPTAPAPAPSAAPPPPAPSPGLSKPLAGAYRGQTSQRLPIVLQVAGSRTSLGKVSFSFRLRCTRRRAPTYRIAVPGWRLHEDDGLGFDDRFTDTTGERYEVRGTFDSSGNAAGFLSTTWRSRRYGSCSSGLVSWGARS